MKIRNLLETTSLPSSFKDADQFMGYVYDNWPSRETHVEHQGHGHWSATIGGDSRISGATYNESTGAVSWLDDEFAELSEKEIIKPNVADKKASEMKYPNQYDRKARSKAVHNKTAKREKVVVRNTKTGQVMGRRTIWQ